MTQWANVQDSDIKVREFEIKPCYYVYLWINTLVKGITPLSRRYGLKSTSATTPQNWVLFLMAYYWLLNCKAIPV